MFIHSLVVYTLHLELKSMYKPQIHAYGAAEEDYLRLSICARNVHYRKSAYVTNNGSA